MAGRLFIVTRTGQSPLTEVYWYADDGVRGAGVLAQGTSTTRDAVDRNNPTGYAQTLEEWVGSGGQAAWPAAT